jgi:hypothetical protein
VHKVLFLLAAAWIAAYPAHAATLFVATTGSDATGDGSMGNPYGTINFASSRALDGDTIRVMPGTYNECVDVSGFAVGAPRSVFLVADAWITSQDNTATVLDGTGVCVFPFATVNVGGFDSSVVGFTIVGGAEAGGVFGIGSVAITNNIVTGNNSTFGGGIYVYSAACYYGDITATVADNTVTGNTANHSQIDGVGGDGGGMYIFAVGVEGTPGGCLTGDVDITVQNNTIENNTAQGNTADPQLNTPFGAGLVVFSNSADTRSVDITVTQNTITGNSHGAGSIGYGGGAWVTSYGYGVETITVTDNTFATNTSSGDGGGLSAWIQTLNLAHHVVTVNDNTVTGNTAAGNGGGLDLFMFADDLGAAESITLDAFDNVVTGNSAGGFLGGGGGILGTFFSQRSVTPAMSFDIHDNRVMTNTSAISGGGMGLFVSADADPEFDIGGPIAPAVATIDVANNLVSTNTAGGGPGGAVGGGVFALVQAFGEATSTLNLDLNTIVNNSAEAGAGGVEIEQFSLDDRLGMQEGQNAVLVDSTIVADNALFGFGGPAAGDPGVLVDGSGFYNLTFQVAYSDIAGNPSGDIEATLPQGGHDFITDDPLLNASGIPDMCSPTLDAANPAFPFALEPNPNGGRANMGHTGTTAQAVLSLADPSGDGVIDGRDILRIAAAFGTMLGELRYDLLADIDGNGLVDGNDLALVTADYGACR